MDIQFNNKSEDCTYVIEQRLTFYISWKYFRLLWHNSYLVKNFFRRIKFRFYHETF